MKGQMKWVALLAASVVVTFAPANAATFEPKVKEVCARAPTEGWVVNRSAFVARLIQKHAGDSAIDLGPDGAPVTAGNGSQIGLDLFGSARVPGCQFKSLS